MKVVEGRGTAKKTRARRQAVRDIDGAPVMPEWLMGRARQIWKQKVAVYSARGQNVVGCEATLAQYCQLEAKLEQLWGVGTPPTAMITAHRVYANEFFDTPASKHVSGPGKKSENRFKRNGKKDPV